MKTLEGMSFETPTGKMTLRACDHQAQTDGWVAVIKRDHEFKNLIPFPFLSEAVKVPLEKISVPPAETGNPRCK